jgi:ADP-ribose pyrophosphatase YjhB (NUDIX family)
VSDHPESIEFIARGLLRRGNQILLCRNAKHGYCYLPGGHVEPGESAGNALEREMAEETGQLVRAGDALLVDEELFIQRGKPRHEVSVVFHVEHSICGKVVSLEAEIEFLWADLDTLRSLTVQPPSISQWLMSGLAGRGFEPGKASWISSKG